MEELKCYKEYTHSKEHPCPFAENKRMSGGYCKDNCNQIKKEVEKDGTKPI